MAQENSWQVYKISITRYHNKLSLAQVQAVFYKNSCSRRFRNLFKFVAFFLTSGKKGRVSNFMELTGKYLSNLQQSPCYKLWLIASQL